MKRNILDSLQEARAAKRPVALVTNLESGRQALLDGDTVTGELKLGGPVLAQARQAILDNRSATLPGTDLFVQAFNPPLRMIVVGAVHIAQSLVPMAALAGYRFAVQQRLAPGLQVGDQGHRALGRPGLLQTVQEFPFHGVRSAIPNARRRPGPCRRRPGRPPRPSRR